MATNDTPFVEVGPAEELADEGETVIRANGRANALFYHEGQFHAIENRCPHTGFPLQEGSVEDGILTCHWPVLLDTGTNKKADVNSSSEIQNGGVCS